MRIIDLLATALLTVLGMIGYPNPTDLGPNPAATAKSWRLPDSLIFCGERVPLEIEDVRERLEDVFYTRMGNDRANILYFKRSGKYFPFFDSVLAAMNMPNDLKYLAVAESSLRIDAVSHAGAAGLWQFISGTGRHWGLTVTKDIDERFHVEKSTQAAMRMLRSLHDQYGSWSLAAAAYNAGQGNITDAVQKQKVDNYYDVFLNRETRYYVFHIAILKELFENSTRYGYDIDSIDRYAPFDRGTRRVSVKGPVKDLGNWAVTQGTNYKTLKLLNFWIMDYSLPTGSFELLLPSGATPVDDRREIEDTSVSELDNGTIKIVHTVRPGDYLIKIAGQYGVRVEDLREWNNLKSDVAPLGQPLTVYIAENRRILHEVSAGDNLTKIAEQYGVTVQQLRDWNQLNDDVARLGSNLVVFVGSK